MYINKEISPDMGSVAERRRQVSITIPVDNPKSGIFVMGRKKGSTNNATRVSIMNGSRFGMLTIVKELPAKRLPCGQINRVFLCKCDCGNLKEVRLGHLRHGKITSCGCLCGEKRIIKNKGLENTYRAMKARTTNKNNIGYKLYMGRGITICDEWNKSYNDFAIWSMQNGYKDGLSIDRIDNNKGYYPGNCRWVTVLQNNCNRRNTVYVNYKGRKESFTLLCKRKGLYDHRAAIGDRIKRGWSVERAIDTPIRKGNYGKKNKKLREASTGSTEVF